MIRAFLIPILAIVGMLYAVVTVVKSSQPRPPALPVVMPPTSPFEQFIAGSGIIETASQNIALGTPVSGTVSKVAVTVGDHVKKGDVLFTIDTRELDSQLAVREADLATARASLKKLESMPRPEEVTPAEARVESARATYDDLKSQFQMLERVTDTRARSEEELSKRRFAMIAAEGRLEEAKAALALVKAGAWLPDLQVAKAQIATAEAGVNQIKTEIERRIIRAPIDCRVLQVNVRPGEFATAAALNTPLMLVGDVSKLHVRVDIDENDAWRAKSGAKAEAFLRGNRDVKTTLQFVRFEPYVIPKKSLTGDATERVDTRVLQMIFSFDPATLPVFVGQQMDVYIEADAVEPVRTADTASAK
jgi:HlyD family secretion protein